METYVLKFSACLGVFWLVYVFFLEHQNMHHFKRFYLLGVLTLALVIPALTITEYVEPIVTNFETAPEYFPMELALEEATIEETPFLNLETTLWFIYGFGVLLFTLRFVINLFKMQHRISKNETVKNQSFIYVLLQENLIPHSFFRYIFLNKTSYESNHIPKEVLLHEETHTKQLHSLDIIILEVLQIVFWFHPLIYILKHHVKLNHEFLADQAVLMQGVNTKTYQNILLQFSSNTQDYQFSSAINYSSIKKRFTVMKTQTSKTRVWLSTLLVLPIIAILFYSFAERVEVIQEKLQNNHEFIQQNITEEQIEAYNAWAKKIHSESKILSKNARWFPPINKQNYGKFSAIYKRMSTEQKKQAVEYPFSGLNIEDSRDDFPLDSITKQQIGEYNTWAKKINTAMETADANPKEYSYPIVKQKIIEKYKRIYNSLSTEQKLNAQPFPKYPPPPPPAKQKISKGGPDLGSHQLQNIQKNKKHIKPVEVLIKKDNSILLNKKLIKIENLTEGVTNINKHLTIEERRNYVSVSVIVEKNNSLDFSEKVQKELNKAEILAITINYKENQEKNSLPTKHNSLFSGLSIEEAKLKKEKYLKESQSKDLLNKKMDSLNNLTPNSNPWSVTTEVTYIRDSEEKEDPQPQEQESILPIVNAKTIKTGKIALTRNEIKDIMLSTKNGKVTEFKFKIPGQPTQHIKSNVLDAEALKHLENAKKDDQLVLFALKDGTNSEIAPIVITVTD
ncbi:M56 family metallopeptidase [Winogradskyella wichelsiae]|uniref:M56 family metallopeptidase n=1 Tax=Winogradskyella wichelsiae TaxID=2697007 RepID=UPI003EF5F5A4